VAVAELAAEIGAEGEPHVEVEAELGRYATWIESMVYRTIQEALVNVRKHAHAHAVAVALHERDGAIAGTIADDGVGFDVESALERARHTFHMGLDTTAERLRLAGGTLTIASSPGEGTTLRFWLPVHRSGDAGEG
jgi:signal transduction histidine kinase